MNKNEFLTKIGVELPPPQVHPQFGTELPVVYLDRCLDVIIPAVEKSWEEAISIDTVIKHLLLLKKKPVSNVVSESVNQDEPVTEVFIEKEPETSQNSNALYDAETGKKVLEYFVKNPDASRVECASALGLTFDIANRICSLLVKEGKMKKNLASGRRRLGTREEIEKWVIAHPDKSREDCAAALGISFTALRNINISDILKRAKASIADADALEIVDDKNAMQITPVEKKAELKEDVKETKTEEEPIVKKEEKKETPATYMQDLKKRYENRNNKSSVGPKLPSFPGFLAEKYFNSLSLEEKEKAVSEFWSVTNVSLTEYKEIVSGFQKLGFTFIKSKLTRLQYNMLKDALANNDWKDMKVVDRYYEYIRS